MAGTGEKERIETALSEVRSLVLGAQILLGFQYRAAFEPRMPSLQPVAHSLYVIAMVLLVASTSSLIAPTSYHQLVAGGDATGGTERYAKRMAMFALAPLSVAIGADLGVALSHPLGLRAACGVGLFVTLVALACWFGPIFARSSRGRGKEDELTSTKERISELLTEVRIVLPGVQALLGFQFASYLTQSFDRLSSAARTVNTVSLLLLVTSMALLMMPAPFHRLAEDGESTPRFERFARRLVLAALPPLALGVSGDVFVVAGTVLGEVTAIALSLACLAGMIALWFGVPLYIKAHGPRGGRS